MMALAMTIAAALPIPGRSVAASQHGVAASSQPLASQAAVQILARGGTAVDAAIAANAVTGVTEPMMNGIGGDLFAIVYIAREDKVYGLNASGWSARAFGPELLKQFNEMPHRGPFSVTVPGAVGGWSALHDRFGKLPLSADLAAAIWYAEHGFPVMEITAGLWASSTAIANDSTFGRMPKAGDVFRNPDLAAALRRIAERGRDGFYKGETAQAVVQAVPFMHPDDLAEWQPEWVEPLQADYRGWTVFELPPNSQGIAALEMLGILSHFPLAAWGFHSARTLHAMIEAKKLAYADLPRYVGDPRFGKVPVTELLSRANSERRAKLIDMQKAACAAEPSKLPMGNDTIYLTVVDGEGNIVSLIQSNYSYFGSAVVPRGMGFALQNRGSLFTLEPGKINTVAGRKRPLHTIIPAFMQRGDVRIGFGIMGGWNQAQAHAQFVADIADFGMTIQQALEAGRFTKLDFSGCDVQIESSVPPEVRAELTALGHQLTVYPPRSTGDFGFGQAVLFDRKSGMKFGASDPRHDGEAIPAPAPYFGK
ncbi:MAG: gamma-glutamyltransferase family protein [Myxococcales bacterium]|nr:gamma-glutamyltransferase family protein [Myxococcales bacterium]